jgi:crossover junction endodeoxyribonuclease RuvC
LVCVLGIDPGLKGALATYDGEYLFIHPIPSVKSKGRGNEVNWSSLFNAHCLYDNCSIAYLEKVGARPKEGVSSAFKFGSIYGGLYVMSAWWTKELPKLVTPQMWKKAIGIGKDKQEAVEKAVELFPDSAHMFYGPRGGLIDGNAEAALIAYYGHSIEEMNNG